MNKKITMTGKTPQRKSYRPAYVSHWEGSGLTKAEYCRRTGIHPNVLTRWIKKYALERKEGPFVKIEAHGISSDFSNAVEVILINGIKIRIAEGMQPAVLREILQAVREL